MELRHLRVGEPEQARDDAHRERERQLAHELGVAAVDERVDVLVDDRGDRLDLPALHRLAAERLLDDPAVGVVLGLVHLEDGVAHHLAHHVLVALRREGLAVAQHRLHRVEGECGEHVRDLAEQLGVDEGGLVLALDLEAGHRPHVLLDQRGGGPRQREQRVRILDHPDARTAVELLERVVLGRLGGAHRILQTCNDQARRPDDSVRSERGSRRMRARPEQERGRR